MSIAFSFSIRCLNKTFFLFFIHRKPTDEVIEAISKVSTNSTSRLNSGTRNKKLTDLTLEQLEFVAFEFKNSNKLHKLLSQIQFFIVLSQDLEARFLNRTEFKELFNECFGFDYTMVETTVTEAIEETEETDIPVKKQFTVKGDYPTVDSSASAVPANNPNAPDWVKEIDKW